MMKKTYATSMPNHIVAFLKAGKCFASLGVNITRVSYDKSVDSHMLFWDVEGTDTQSGHRAGKIGYLQNNASNSSIVLIEFCLKDVPGSVTAALELINSFRFNISYFDFGYLHFEVYEGKGGHLSDEVVLIDYNNNIAFTGDRLRCACKRNLRVCLLDNRLILTGG